MGQAESSVATTPGTCRTSLPESQGVSSRIQELQNHAISLGSTVPRKPSSTIKGTQVQNDLMEAAADFLQELMIESYALATKKLQALLVQLLNSSRDLENEQLLLETRSQQELHVPEWKGDHFQVGEKSLEDFTFYVRIGLWGSIKQYFHSNSKAEKFLVSVGLRLNEKDFSNREFSVQAFQTLDLKFPVKSNAENLYHFLDGFSLQVQISMEGHPSNPSLLAEIRTQRSLIDNFATSFLLPVQANLESTHYVDCFVFLERPSEDIFGSSAAGKTAKRFCSDCIESNDLLRVYREVKRSVTTIDLASVPKDAPPKELTLKDQDALSNFHPENTETSSMEPCLTFPAAQENQELNKGPSQIQKTSSEAARPHREIATAKVWKPARTLKKRNHKEFSPYELQMMEKLARMQQRLKQLEDDLADTGPQSEAPIILTPAAKKCYDSRNFTCPEPGCTEKFNNKSTLSRHRKRIHFPNRLPKCHNCEHVFPRPYMLKRHLDRMVCMSTRVTKLRADRIASAGPA